LLTFSNLFFLFSRHITNPRQNKAVSFLTPPRMRSFLTF